MVYTLFKYSINTVALYRYIFANVWDVRKLPPPKNRTRIVLYSSTKILHTFFFLRIAPLAIQYILQYIGSSYILNRFVLVLIS